MSKGLLEGSLGLGEQGFVGGELVFGGLIV
jgi:hypothetical protein